MRTFELEFMGIYIGGDKNYPHYDYKNHFLSIEAEDHKAAIAAVGLREDYMQEPSFKPHVIKVDGRPVDHCGNFHTWQDNPQGDFEIRAAKKSRGEAW